MDVVYFSSVFVCTGASFLALFAALAAARAFLSASAAVFCASLQPKRRRGGGAQCGTRRSLIPLQEEYRAQRSRYRGPRSSSERHTADARPCNSSQVQLFPGATFPGAALCTCKRFPRAPLRTCSPKGCAIATGTGCPFTCQFDWLSDQFCKSFDQLSDHFAEHCPAGVFQEAWWASPRALRRSSASTEV